MKLFSSFLIAIFSLVVLAFLFLASLRFLRYELETKTILFTIGSLEVPAFWMNLIFPLGFALLFIHFFIQTFSLFHRR